MSNTKDPRPQYPSGWFATPNLIIRSDLLTPQEKCVWCALASYNPSFPTYIELTKRLHISDDTLSKAIKRLIELNLIQVTKGRLGRANQYEVLPEPAWISTFTERENALKSEIKNKKKTTQEKKLKGKKKLLPTTSRGVQPTSSQVGTKTPHQKHTNGDTSPETVSVERATSSKTALDRPFLKGVQAKLIRDTEVDNLPTPQEEALANEGCLNEIINRSEADWAYSPLDEYEPTEHVEPLDSFLARWT